MTGYSCVTSSYGCGIFIMKEMIKMRAWWRNIAGICHEWMILLIELIY